jgi:hypothetical protein
LNPGTKTWFIHNAGVWELGEYQGEVVDVRHEIIDGTVERMDVPYTRLTFAKEEPKYPGLVDLDETFFFPVTYPLIALIGGMLAFLFHWLIGWSTLWYSIMALLMFIALGVVNYLKNYTTGRMKITMVYYRGTSKAINEMGKYYVIMGSVKNSAIKQGEELILHHIYITPLADEAIPTLQKDVAIALPIFESIQKMRDIVNVKIPRDAEVSTQDRETRINDIILDNLSSRKGKISRFLYNMIVKEGKLLDEDGNPRGE